LLACFVKITNATINDVTNVAHFAPAAILHQQKCFQVCCDAGNLEVRDLARFSGKN